MRKIFTILTSLLTLPLFLSPVFAEDTSLSDVNNNSTVQVSATNPLGLNIPNQTDNPSITITFTDPSADAQGVQLDTDTKGFATISSPYTFPALSIGKHILEFKFADKDGVTQLYDTSVIIIPRVPVLTSASVKTDKVTVTGTGLANSELITILSSGSDVVTKTTTIDENGKWSISIDRNEFSGEVYSINAYVRRYGYASDLSETTKFTFKDTSNSVSDTETQFAIGNITLEKVKSFISSNQTAVILSLAGLLIGILLGILFSHSGKKNAQEKVTKTVEKQMSKKVEEKPGMTLREKLLGKEEDRKEEKVVSKIDFLKDFKNFDPDDEKGKEEKQQVEVSLTSKK
jgi:hypothetical protein